MTKKIFVHEFPVFSKGRSISLSLLQSRAKEIAAWLCEIIPPLIGLRSGVLTHEVLAKNNDLYIAIYLVSSPQLQLQLGPCPNISEDAWLEEDAKRIVDNLYKIQEELARESDRLNALSEAPFSLQPTPTSRILSRMKGKSIDIKTASGELHIAAPPNTPMKPTIGVAPDFIRGAVASVEKEFMKLDDVSYLRGTGYVSLVKARRIYFPDTADRTRFAVLAEVASRSDTSVEAEVQALINPSSARISGLMLNKFLNEEALCLKALQIIGTSDKKN